MNVPFAVGALFFTFGCTSAYVETILVLGARWSDGSGGFDEVYLYRYMYCCVGGGGGGREEEGGRRVGGG